VFNPFTWSTRSNEAAVCNARLAATELSRERVECEEIEIFLARLAERRRTA
jgi:hypothetical protein